MSMDSGLCYEPSVNSHTNLIPPGKMVNQASLPGAEMSSRHQQPGVTIDIVGTPRDASSSLSSPAPKTASSLQAPNNEDVDSCYEPEDLDTTSDLQESQELATDNPRPRTRTSDLADFLRETGPEQAPTQKKFPMSGQLHFLWDEPPASKKRSILARARNVVGLRRQKSEHNVLLSNPQNVKRRDSLHEEKYRDFDIHIRTQNLTKRILPNGKSYYTITPNGPATQDEAKIDPLQPSATSSTLQEGPRQRSKASSGIGLPSATSRLRGIAGRSTSMSSFADPSVRPVSSNGSHDPLQCNPSSAINKTEMFRPSLSRNNSLKLSTPRASRAASVSSQDFVRTIIAESEEPNDKPPRSPAMSLASACTAPNPSIRKLDGANSHSYSRIPANVECRGSIKTLLYASGEFPGLIARSTSAMSEAQRASSISRASLSSQPCPSPLPPLPSPSDDGQSSYGSAVASPTHSTWSSSVPQRVPTFMALTADDIETVTDHGSQVGHGNSGRSTAPPSPNPDSQAGPAVMPLEILRPSDFAGRSTERDHSRSKSRSLSSSAHDHRVHSSLTGLLSPPRSFGKKDGAKVARSETNAESELLQDWTMPRNQAAVKAAHSASALGTASQEEDLLPQVLQRALSPPSRRKTGRNHSRTGSLDSLGGKLTPSQDRTSEDGHKSSAELSVRIGGITPVPRISPLRNTISLPESGSDNQISPESKRSGTTRKARPLSSSSTKSEHDSNGSASKRNSRPLSSHQEPPSTSLEVDSKSLGLGLLRSSFGHVHELDLNVDQSSSNVLIDEPLSANSPAAAIWMALEGMRAEYMISELRSEQERARFRVLARRNADALESTQGALEAERRRNSKGSGLRSGRSQQAGSKRPKSQRGQRPFAGQKSEAAIDDAITAVITELREYATSTSPRQSRDNSRSQSRSVTEPSTSKSMETAIVEMRNDVDSEGEWADVADDDEIDSEASQSVVTEKAGSSKPFDESLQDVTLLGDDGAPGVSSAEEEEDEDDGSSHRTDASTDMGRDTLSRATTLEDVAGAAATYSPKTKSQRALSGSESGESLRGPSGSDGAIETLEDVRGLSQGDTKKGRAQEGTQRSPSISQSPRSFGSISEDGAFEDEETLSFAYDEDGPFNSSTGGFMYSLRAAGSALSRHGVGSVSLSRQRRCESMSTIVSEDARSEIEHPSSPGHGQSQESQGVPGQVRPSPPPPRPQRRRPTGSTGSESRSKSMSGPSSPPVSDEARSTAARSTLRSVEDADDAGMTRHGRSLSGPRNASLMHPQSRPHRYSVPAGTGSFLEGLDAMGISF